MRELILNNQYPNLFSRIKNEVQKGQEEAFRSINHVLVETYWKIGMHIVEFEQEGQKKAVYGAELLNRLSKDLSLSYGKGFGRSNLFQIRAFYLKFPKIQTLSGFLSWSHYVEILIEYACENISNQSFVSKYQLYLSDKEKLRKELQILLDN